MCVFVCVCVCDKYYNIVCVLCAHSDSSIRLSLAHFSLSLSPLSLVSLSRLFLSSLSLFSFSLLFLSFLSLFFLPLLFPSSLSLFSFSLLSLPLFLYPSPPSSPPFPPRLLYIRLYLHIIQLVRYVSGYLTHHSLFICMYTYIL